MEVSYETTTYGHGVPVVTFAPGATSGLGSTLGIALLAIITSSLILLDVSVYWQELVSGVILLAAVSMDYLSHKRKA